MYFTLNVYVASLLKILIYHRTSANCVFFVVLLFALEREHLFLRQLQVSQLKENLPLIFTSMKYVHPPASLAVYPRF